MQSERHMQRDEGCEDLDVICRVEVIKLVDVGAPNLWGYFKD